MGRGDGQEVEAGRGSAARVALRGREGPSGGAPKPRAARGWGHAAQGFRGELRVGGAVWEKRESENRTVERLGGTVRGPDPRPPHLTWRRVGVQV